jgi:type II secretory pathway predicted ATPase ExeA
LFDYVSRQKNYKAGRRSAAKLSLNQSRGAPLFSDDAVRAIHAHARGLPRAINRLAITALLAACAAGKTIIDESSARAAISEEAAAATH